MNHSARSTCSCARKFLVFLKVAPATSDKRVHHVTHDQEEALTMSHINYVFSEGRVGQVGSPVEEF